MIMCSAVVVEEPKRRPAAVLPAAVDDEDDATDDDTDDSITCCLVMECQGLLGVGSKRIMESSVQGVSSDAGAKSTTRSNTREG